MKVELQKKAPARLSPTSVGPIRATAWARAPPRASPRRAVRPRGPPRDAPCGRRVAGGRLPRYLVERQVDESGREVYVNEQRVGESRREHWRGDQSFVLRPDDALWPSRTEGLWIRQTQRAAAGSAHDRHSAGCGGIRAGRTLVHAHALHAGRRGRLPLHESAPAQRHAAVQRRPEVRAQHHVRRVGELAVVVPPGR